MIGFWHKALGSLQQPRFDTPTYTNTSVAGPQALRVGFSASAPAEEQEGENRAEGES